MTLQLSAVEARVLGALVEKEITTPEYYPLSLNSLVNACNQKNNREPVMNLDEDTVRQALHQLEDKGLAGPHRGGESRVPKYEHRMQEVFNFTRGETAILCVLLLRGPQTVGELRGRTERLHRFEELSDVQSVLDRLQHRDPPLVTTLPRQPGMKEVRHAHLLSGDMEGLELIDQSGSFAATTGIEDDRVLHLEAQLAALKQEVAELKRQVEKLLELAG